jgi:hypothetical protein
MNVIDNVAMKKIGFDAGTTPLIYTTHASSMSTNATTAAATLGAVSRKLQIFDKDDNSLGSIPIYDAMT